MAGYLETPLAKKLGTKAGCRMYVSGAPAHHDELIAPLPDAVSCFQRSFFADLVG
jgi:hypothetical protein